MIPDKELFYSDYKRRLFDKYIEKSKSIFNCIDYLSLKSEDKIELKKAIINLLITEV
jgi:hypothetical protein